jgi:DNA-binding beta-propeller fold protein YncE
VIRVRVSGFSSPLLAALATAATLVGCKTKPSPPAPATTAAGASAGATVAGAAGAVGDPAASAAPAPPARSRSHEGGAVSRGFDGKRVFVADEDHKAVRVVPVPLSAGPDAARSVRVIDLPGPAGNVLALADGLLVTVREPGLLVAFSEREGAFVETARVSLPADAWGLAVTPDERTVVVTSPWTAQVSIVPRTAAGGFAPPRSLAVDREPRGVVVRHDGSAAYVSHLTSAALTRVDLAKAEAQKIELPPSPLRAPMGVILPAALGYSLALSADGRRLFAPRHAIGAQGHESWFGASGVDVLLTDRDRPASPRWFAGSPAQKSPLASQLISGSDVARPGGPLGLLTQPRAIAFRERTNSVLVLSEGNDSLIELDALSPSPTDAVLGTQTLGFEPDAVGANQRGAAPAGLALSEDEQTAWVFCRSSYDLVEVALGLDRTAAAAATGKRPILHLVDDPLGGDAASGRRVFFSALDKITSGGLACAGCHPEGRDDGQVWHEATFTTADGEHANFVGHAESVPKEAQKKGFPRRTPLLAGRVAAKGPYGWHGENADIVGRLRAGFGLHRWGGIPKHEDQNLTARALYLTAFVRTGLREPPHEPREPTAQEKEGKAIFTSERAQCNTCHNLDQGLSDRVSYPLPMLPVQPGFEREENKQFKTPSLLHLAGRAPYFHDGSAGSLEALIEKNNDRMGKTVYLTSDQKAALVAYLRTL